MQYLKSALGIPTEKDFPVLMKKYRDVYYVFEQSLPEQWLNFLQPLVTTDWESPGDMLNFVKEKKHLMPDSPLILPKIVSISQDGKWEAEVYEKEFNDLLNKFKYLS